MPSSIDENISKTVKWKQNIENLLHHTNICSVCLGKDEKLRSLNDVFHVKNHNIEDEQSLRNILIFTFGYRVIHMLPTTFFCDRCSTVILKSFLILKEIKQNHDILQKYLENVSEQVNEMTRNTSDECEKLENDINKKGKTKMNKKKYKRKLEITINPIELDGKDDQVVICQTNDTTSDSDNSASEYETRIDLKYECPYCAYKSDDIKALRGHCFDCQPMETVYECCKCRKKFKMLNKLVEHRNLIHLDSISSCTVCNVILNDMGIREHENLDHENLIFICDSCQSLFETKSSLLEHIADVHSTGFTCQHCLQNFTNEFKLNHHRCTYKCFECKEECIHVKYLLSFREQHINNQMILKCADCDFTYKTRSQLIRHVNEDHLKHYPYLCVHCGEKFASKPLLRIHTYNRHESEVTDITMAVEGSSQSSQICKLCNMVFNSEESYTSHRKRHLGEQSQCQFCSKVFCSFIALNMHLKTRHENEEDGYNTTYQCTMCPSDFNYKADYLKHVANHPEGSKHVCRICNQEFISKINYTSHLRKHQIKYDKECHICFKKYTRHTINRHMRSHLKEGNETNSKNVSLISTMCDACGSLLQNEQSLLKHSEMHKEEIKCPHCESLVNTVLFAGHVKNHKKYENLKYCSKCDYTTRFSVCLEGHINRYHLKIRPYECEICSKRFYSEYTLKGHQQTHSVKREEHYCEICGKKFISKKALVLHTRLHTGERPYPCDLCELSFLSSSRREQHKVRKHFEPSVECSLCDKKMYTNSDLRRHMNDRHSDEPKRRKKIVKQTVLTIVDAD